MMGKRWIGRWIIAVSAGHTIIGLALFWSVIMGIAKAGFWNSIGEDPMRGAVAWFLLAGGFMLVSGLAVDAIEQAGQPVAIRRAGLALLLVTVLGILLMPVSGFWLLLPPAIAMLRRGSGS